MTPLPLESLRQRIPPEILPALAPGELLPHPFPVGSDLEQRLGRLGLQIHAFVKACNDLYALSADGRQPEWIAHLVDQGRNPHWIELGRSKSLRNSLPGLLQPELVLTAQGFALSDLHLTPNGIGHAACAQSAYGGLGMPVLGGASGIRDAFDEATTGCRLLTADAFGCPGLQWLAARCSREICDLGSFAAHTATGHSARAARFFSTASLESSPQGTLLLSHLREGVIDLTPAPKPQLEEKLWLCLLPLRPLRAFWRRALSDRHFEALLKIITPCWILDPTPLPPQAEITGLGVTRFEDLLNAPLGAREFFIHASREAGGAQTRPAAAQGNFSEALRCALEAFPNLPHVLMQKPEPLFVEHPFQDPSTGRVRLLKTSVRLRPFYFASGKETRLAGLMAGLTPSSGHGTAWVPGTELGYLH